MPLTDTVQASLRLSKGACLSFVATETAGYRSQMQSSTTKGKLIAWPPSDEIVGKGVGKKEQRERQRKGERPGCNVVH